MAMSSLNLNEIKDAERRIAEGELTIWNARLTAAANDPEALEELLEARPSAKPKRPPVPTNGNCPCPNTLGCNSPCS